MVEQTGEYADQLSSNLGNIELPDGFPIELFAVAPDARHMEIVTLVGTRKQTSGLSARRPVCSMASHRDKALARNVRGW